MDSITQILVSIAIEQLFPDTALTSFTKFLPEQLSLESQSDVAFWKHRNHQCAKKLEGGIARLLIEKVSKSSEFYNLHHTLYPFLRILLKP